MRVNVADAQKLPRRTSIIDAVPDCPLGLHSQLRRNVIHSALHFGRYKGLANGRYEPAPPCGVGSMIVPGSAAASFVSAAVAVAIDAVATTLFGFADGCPD